MKRNEKLQLAAAVLFFALIIGMKIATGQTPTPEPPTFRPLTSSDLPTDLTEPGNLNADASAEAGVQPTLKLDTAILFNGYSAIAVTREYHGNGFTIPDPPTRVIFNGGIAGNWLTVERHNKTAHDAKGFDPCLTTILSDFKPVSKKRADGKWETTFESELNHQRLTPTLSHPNRKQEKAQKALGITRSHQHIFNPSVTV